MYKRPSLLKTSPPPTPKNLPAPTPGLSPSSATSPRATTIAARFAFFSRKRNSTSTTGAGSFSTNGDSNNNNTGSGLLFKGGNGNDDSEFEFTVVDGGQFEVQPRLSDIDKDAGAFFTNSSSSSLNSAGARASLLIIENISATAAVVAVSSNNKNENLARTPRVSELSTAKASKSTLGVTAPVMIGRDGASGQDPNKDDFKYKQSYKSRHKVPNILKELNNEADEFEFPSQQASPKAAQHSVPSPKSFARMKAGRSASFRDQEGEEEDIPPPPAFPDFLDEDIK